MGLSAARRPAGPRLGEVVEAMSRRTTSLVVSAALLLVLVSVAFSVPMPYVLLSPGLTANVLGDVEGKPVIQITGAKTYPVDGHLDLTTVSVSSQEYHPRLPDVLASWISPDEVVIPRDVYYPPDQPAEKVEEENRAAMSDSQSAAVVVGLEQAGIDPYAVEVKQVEPGAPADGRLEPGDRILSVDGKQVGSTEDAATAIGAVAPGDVVALLVRRGPERLTVEIRTEQSEDDPEKARIGIGLGPLVEVDINVSENIGGPSAGLVFSVAIYDLLTPGALTGGRFVAGTGTIDADGKVGPIGGILQKIIGAYKGGDGASVFLVPADNCEEAGASELADDILLVKVATIDDAVSALESIDVGDEASLTLCGR